MGTRVGYGRSLKQNILPVLELILLCISIRFSELCNFQDVFLSYRVDDIFEKLLMILLVL